MPLKNSLAMKSGVGSATFTRSSTATYIDRYGVLQTAAVDTPRFEKEGYLNEGVSTNLLTYSEKFDNSVWIKPAATISANTTATTDPYGTNLADKLTEDSTTNTHLVYQSVTVASATLTFSCFVKAAESTKFRLSAYESTTPKNPIIADFDLSAVTASTASASTVSATITPLSNGWFRVSATTTSAALVATTFSLQTTRLGTGNYTGDGTSGLYIFGAQLEALLFSSSYIPTVASAVTRAMDSLNISLANNFPSVYKSRSILADFDTKGKAGTDWNSIIAIDNCNDGKLVFGYGNGYDFQTHGGKNTNMLASVNIPFDTVTKRVCSVSNSISNSSSIYKNGVLLNTSSLPQQFNDLVDNSASSFMIGRLWYGHIANLRIYDSALTAYEVALA
jgi:hypothetical protein